jgi:hypothetical protein
MGFKYDKRQSGLEEVRLNRNFLPGFFYPLLTVNPLKILLILPTLAADFAVKGPFSSKTDSQAKA